MPLQSHSLPLCSSSETLTASARSSCNALDSCEDYFVYDHEGAVAPVRTVRYRYSDSTSSGSLVQEQEQQQGGRAGNLAQHFDAEANSPGNARPSTCTPPACTRPRSKFTLHRSCELDTDEAHGNAVTPSPPTACSAPLHPTRLGSESSAGGCDGLAPSPFQAASLRRPMPHRRGLQQLQCGAGAADHHRRHDTLVLASFAGLGPAATAALASLPRSSTRLRQALQPSPTHSTRPPLHLSSTKITPSTVSSPATSASTLAPSTPSTGPGEIECPVTPSLSSASSSAASTRLLRLRCAHSLPLPTISPSTLLPPHPTTASSPHSTLPTTSRANSRESLVQGQTTVSSFFSTCLGPSLSDPAPGLLASWFKHATSDVQAEEAARQLHCIREAHTADEAKGCCGRCPLLTPPAPGPEHPVSAQQVQERLSRGSAHAHLQSIGGRTATRRLKDTGISKE